MGDLRGWELVLNGTLLLHTSEYGDGMNGRYAALWDRPSMFGDALDLLPVVLAAAGKIPTRVVTVLDRDSQVLAAAVADRLGLQTVAMMSSEPMDEACLLVVYDWSSHDQNAFLAHDGERATFFAYGMDWTNPQQLAPDVAFVHAQHIYPPWGEQTRVTGPPGTQGGSVIHEPADDRDPDVVGREAAAWTSDAASDHGSTREGQERADVLALLEATARGGGDIGLLTGRRHRFYPDGPVASSRFL